jgi:uncharacterized RDD family membrane protein YckC
MSDLPPPPENQPPPPPAFTPPPPPPPAFTNAPPPGYVAYGEHRGVQADLAGFWIRFVAALLDGILVGIVASVVGAVISDGDGTNLFSLVIGVAYYGLLEGGATGQTIGKKVCNVRVVDVQTGLPGIGVGRGIGRYFARWLSAIPLLLGYFWMLWDPKKQTWHDKLVSTIVVKG